ncbi:di-trans,poly-cis-decaprenylcistransferase [Gloeocapsopsis sp. IPPAS B-1203]|nr:di-trans,poly-cis-decaprenylcistransferase [Gloeocapsopsis sp. IPPAS B-1203]
MLVIFISVLARLQYAYSKTYRLHYTGIAHIVEILDICHDFGINNVSAYVWSTENWGRPTDEVRALMIGIEKLDPRLADELDSRQVRILHSGSREGVSESVLNVIDDAVNLTKTHNHRILNLAFNYGGRAEIVEGVRKVVTQQPQPEEITETTFARCLYTAELPDLDLVIRAGGEQRLSNYFLWQSAYAQLYFTEAFWSTLSQQDIKGAIDYYNERLSR